MGRINTKVKGRNAEKECARLLEQAGWLVELVKPPKKYNLQNDFFGGLFDIIALKGKYMKLIQVKCNRKCSQIPYLAFGKQYGNKYRTIEIWVRVDNKPANERWFIHTVWCDETMEVN